MQDKHYLRVLGSADWLPTKGNDGSSFLLDDIIMVDTGWSVAYNMICHDLDPIMSKLLCFTHMHADHYMGLTQLILYWRIKKGSLGEWTIAGPKQSVKSAYERAFRYVFHDSPNVLQEVKEPPCIIELSDGDNFSSNGYQISVMSSDHAVPGLCYRFTNQETGFSIGFTGDTRYRESFANFFRNCDLLVHEVSFGAGPINPVANAICKHSSAEEAIKVAKEAQVKGLLLTHASQEKQNAALAVAKTKLDIPVNWASPLKKIVF